MLAREPLCAECGGLAEHVDHIQPIARGGTDYQPICAVVCAACNSPKGRCWKGTRIRSQARQGGYGRKMIVVPAQEPSGGALVTVHCDGCPRQVSTDTLTPEELCALTSWAYSPDLVLCVLCQWQRGKTPSFAKRYPRAA